MKGVILAGGTGSRLSPLTNIICKHLLPVGPYPMIYWPILKLKEAGINKILIVTNKENLPFFIKLIGDGEEFGIHLQYKIQQNAKGISDGISLAKEFVGEEKFIVLLGDNIFEDSLIPYIHSFKQQKEGAKVLLKKVSDPQRFGIATINHKKGIITSIEEKPENPLSDYCVVGIYMYDKQAFKFIEHISPSARGELEVTDLNNMYIKQQQLSYDFLKGWWIDAGTPESLYKANSLIFEKESKGE